MMVAWPQRQKKKNVLQCSITTALNRKKKPAIILILLYANFFPTRKKKKKARDGEVTSICGPFGQNCFEGNFEIRGKRAAVCTPIQTGSILFFQEVSYHPNSLHRCVSLVYSQQQLPFYVLDGGTNQ